MDALETSPRFDDRFDDQLADHPNSEDCANTKNTEKNIKYALKVFVEFCKVNQTTVALVDTMSDAELDGFLQRFYAEVRQVNGESYCKKSMQAIRYGLQRHFKQRGDRPVNIVKDEAFKLSNNAFRSALNRLKKLGKDLVQNKRNPISAVDMERINRSPVTDISTPAGLQNKVFMDVMIYFCNRGRVNIRGFRKTDFDVHRDSKGLRYITKRGTLSRTHRDIDDITTKRRQADIMYESPGNPRCPVRTFLFYRQKLNPACDFLWQRPKDKLGPADEIWYTIILGKNTMANKLKVISQAAKCSRIYTNYCFHYTSITVLENAGLQAKDSMNLSQNSEVLTGNRQGGREIPSSSDDDDGSSSELDDQENPSLHHQAYIQDQDDQLGFGFVDMEHEEIIPVKEEEGEILPDHYYQQDAVGHRPVTVPSSRMDVSHISQNGNQETVEPSPSRLNPADRSERQNNVYPVSINIGPNFDSTAQAPASNPQSENDQPGFDSSSWTVERSWLDENNKRKCLLTRKETSSQTSHGGSEVRNGTGSTNAVRTASGGRSGISTASGNSRRTSTAYCNGIGTPIGCSGGIMPSSGCCCGRRTTADEQLLQLQMNVLRMQQENLALERRKIEAETAKLEAERLKLESERRKFTIEGNILLRDREML